MANVVFQADRVSVYWIPSHRTYGLERKHINERIKECNDILYDVLKDDLLRDSGGINMHGFLDLFSLSCPLRRLTRDGDKVHMKMNWHETLAKHLLELHCNS